jgi:large subunit ribosomal protein L19
MSEDNQTTKDNKPEEAPVEPAKPEATPAEATEPAVKEEPKEAEAPAATEEVTADKAEAITEEATDESAPATDSKDETMDEEPVVTELPNRNVKPGMLVRVHEVIKDINAKGEERERVQMFEGTVLGLSGEGISRTMTVRKISGGIGVEKIYPLASPHVQKIEVVKQYRVRRSKLWYLRRDKKKRKMYEDTRKSAV